MVDPDPGYRPRRAFAEPTAGGGPTDDVPTEPTDAPPTTDGPAPDVSAKTGPAPVVPTGADEDDQPPPLYRDESTATGPQAGVAEAAAEATGETKAVRPLNFQARARRTPEDDESTTLLARTPAGGRRPGSGRDERLDADDHGRRLGRRGRLALLVGALAAVIAVGLAIGYAVTTVGNPTADPRPGVSGGPSGSAGPTTPGADPAAALADEALLSPTQAEDIAAGTWTVALTQQPPAVDAPIPACTSDEPVDGDPAAEQKAVRLLSDTGAGSPSALHQAALYATAEDAAQAYTVAARTLGGCATPGAYLYAGSTVTGLGDQSTGVVANVVTAGKTQWHSIVLSRTGSVVNLMDAAQASRALAVSGVATALASVTQAQCSATGTPCTTDVSEQDGPPPLGGDVPGFLATGDLPPVGDAEESWVATPAEPPTEDFLGSGCETVNWAQVGAETASTRVYLVAGSTKFGLNDIVLTMKSEKAATDLVAKIKSDLDSCSKRKLTASVSDPQRVDGVGAQAAAVRGWTSTVAQKSTEGTERYRVGIVSSGTKVAYTFLSPQPNGYDLTDGEWDRVAVRAGQRMTQVP